MSVTFLFLVVTAKINQLVVYIAMLFKHFSLRWIFSLIFWNIFVRRNQENECFGHTYLHERANNLFQIVTKQSNFSQSALIKLYIILFFLFWFQPQYSQNLTAFCNDICNTHDYLFRIMLNVHDMYFDISSNSILEIKYEYNFYK